MNATICSMQPATAFRAAKQPAQTPLIPALWGRTVQRVQHAAAFSLYSGESQAQGPFSFLHPEVPVEDKPEKPRSRTAAYTKKTTEEQQRDLAATLGAPRFRSALEQVSYLTNESNESAAMRRR